MLSRLSPLLKLLGLALACLLLIDLLVFRSGWYNNWIKPDSTAGATVGAVMKIQRYREPALKNVLVLGNSKIGEGFSGPVANLASGRPDLHFLNGSIAGTTPRVWNYLLRKVDPDVDRFAAIALMVDYDLTKLEQDMGNFRFDTSHLRPLLGLQDWMDYPASFSDAEERHRARRAILLPMQAMHEDVRELLKAPWRRYRQIVVNRPAWLKAVVSHPGRNQVLPELEIDSETGMPKTWGSLQPDQQASLQRYFAAIRRTATAQRQTENADYLRRWVGAIAERYRAAGIPVIVFSVPRGPWHQSLVAPPTPNAVLQSMVADGLLQTLPGDAFVELEQPQYFFDDLHLNSAGRERFSQMLAAQIAPLLH